MRLRGYNYIDDFVRMNEDPFVFSLENDLAALQKISKLYHPGFDNRDEEMRRFIAWAHWTYAEEEFQYLLQNDVSGFMKSCLELYNPMKDPYREPPKHPFDFTTDYSI